MGRLNKNSKSFIILQLPALFCCNSLLAATYPHLNTGAWHGADPGILSMALPAWIIYGLFPIQLDIPLFFFGKI